MDCWWESALHNWGCVWSTRETGKTSICSGVLDLFRQSGREPAMTPVKCHRVRRVRVTSEAPVAGSPAESVCPPGPGHAPPPLYELFPWLWCQGGHTWWSCLLLRKTVVERGRGWCCFLFCTMSLNLNLTHAGKTCNNLSVPEVLIERFPSFFIGPVRV